MLFVDDPYLTLPECLPHGWTRVAEADLASFPARFLVCCFVHPDAVEDQAGYDTHYRKVFTACRDRAVRLLPLSAARLAADFPAEAANLARLLTEAGAGTDATAEVPAVATVPTLVPGRSELAARSWYGKLAFNSNYGPMAVPDFRAWKFEPGRCSFCGSEDSRPLLLDVHASGHDLHECRVCGLWYYGRRVPFRGPLEHGFASDTTQAKVFEAQFTLGTRPVKSVAHQRELLSAYYRSVWETSLSFWLANHPKTAPTTAFDIGCGNGFMLEVLQHLCTERFGAPLRMSACEINRACAECARSRGIDCAACAFEDWTPQGRSFDLVSSFDFLEHTYTPYADLCRIAAAMPYGGVLTAKTFVQELDSNCTLMAPPGHSHHFTEDLLTRMFQQAGIKVIRVDRAAPMCTFWGVKK